jgi:DNA-binding NarL/FixJ family response regulator
VAATIDGALARTQHAYARALIDRDAAALYAAANAFSDIDALLYAADAATQAAVLFESANQRRRHLDSAAVADRVATACGDIQTLALSLAANPLPLSIREREIANLAARGLSNRDIAERLTVSLRTVEGHIYRACIKLDVTDREALAVLIRKT